MRHIARRAGVIGFLILLVTSIGATQHVAAQNNSVHVGVGDTSVRIEGLTSPSSQVTVLDGGTVIGSTTSDAFGDFVVILTDQQPGIRTYGLFAQDAQARFSDTVTVTTNVVEHAQTTIEVFLPPIVRIDPSEVTQGDPVTISGATKPGATVVIYIDSTSVTVTADAEGKWAHTLTTQSLAAGQHQVYVVATVSGNQSEPSKTRSFFIEAPVTAPVSPSPQPNTGSPAQNNPGSTPAVPVITSPQPGATISTDTITVEGTADPGTQVELWNNGEIVGSAFAGADGKWRITFTPSEYANRIKVRACRATICSDFSDSSAVFSDARKGDGPIVWLDKYRWRVTAGDPLRIKATIRGGETPYTIKLDWDKTNDQFNSSELSHVLEHIYQKAGKYSGRVTVTDNNGKMAVAYFSVEVTPRPLALLGRSRAVPILIGITGAILLLFGLQSVGQRWRRSRIKRSK